MSESHFGARKELLEAENPRVWYGCIAIKNAPNDIFLFLSLIDTIDIIYYKFKKFSFAILTVKVAHTAREKPYARSSDRNGTSPLQ
jgi:hypothetical protein